ncbi:hypothetical protein CWE08_08510 [Aliidiomarina iranensis]|uniref:Uncharacterized protein n=1 Tax=Aliidiomarina iranensis TaxID=1434071 RepID=A0A432VU31_9GAMM|nr:hypothetical protein CWE08_08510 [Aliidiomarina iranensis]
MRDLLRLKKYWLNFEGCLQDRSKGGQLRICGSITFRPKKHKKTTAKVVFLCWRARQESNL